MDAVAKRLAEWIGYDWDGLPDRSIVDRGHPEWAYNGIGQRQYQGGKDDLRKLAAEIAREIARIEK